MSYMENQNTARLLRKYDSRIKLSELTEAVNRGLIGQDEVEQAIKSKKLESLRSPVNFTSERKVMLAQCLENVADRLAYMEATNPMALGAYKRYALDITNAVTANLIAPELVGTHTLEGRNGIVRYFNFNYGRDKGATKKGDTFNSSLNMPANDPYYASNLVDGEEVKFVGGKYIFKWVPIKLTTFTVEADGKIYSADGFLNPESELTYDFLIGTLSLFEDEILKNLSYTQVKGSIISVSLEKGITTIRLNTESVITDVKFKNIENVLVFKDGVCAPYSRNLERNVVPLRFI